MNSPIEPTRHDGVRVLLVIVSAALAVVGSFIGSGALVGTPIAQVADGALAADATAVAPGGPAFSIWTLIYAGFLAYAIWQALPAHRADVRQRQVGWWYAAAMVLNAVWITCVQFEQLWLSVLVIIALLAVLVVVFGVLTTERPSGRAEAVVVDGTAYIYLGWVCVAVVANIAATLAAADIDPFGLGPDTWAVLVLALVAVVAGLLAVAGHGRFTVTAAIVWGLGWIVVARTSGDGLDSRPAAIAATVAAAVALVATAVTRANQRRQGRLVRKKT
ncbi:tryptophan-rich sensory protein [Rhodococcus sp. USK10]|uniref:TspO/MBR family protein n=1 Tax=Rhodococcus sp. USK10 TaxID=2789739 RepID=UPI001C607DE6|nr:TspO/MBR family protein [Rhodococcus sp. USK10]QYB07579.1 tryptophan-rich sensory protein [Rhodococcus sp. USK10]